MASFQLKDITKFLSSELTATGEEVYNCNGWLLYCEHISTKEWDKKKIVVNNNNDAGKGAVVTVTFCFAALSEHTVHDHHWLVGGLEFAVR